MLCERLKVSGNELIERIQCKLLTGKVPNLRKITLSHTSSSQRKVSSIILGFRLRFHVPR